MPQCCGCQYGETSMSVGGSERRNATRPTRRNGRNIEFSADLTRIVPCDAVAIGGKLLQNNGIELCAPDRCCDSGGSPSAPSLSAGIARHGLQLCCAGYFGQGCTPRERTCRYCRLTDRRPTASTRDPCTLILFRHRRLLKEPPGSSACWTRKSP